MHSGTSYRHGFRGVDLPAKAKSVDNALQRQGGGWDCVVLDHRGAERLTRLRVLHHGRRRAMEGGGGERCHSSTRTEKTTGYELEKTCRTGQTGQTGQTPNKKSILPSLTRGVMEESPACEGGARARALESALRGLSRFRGWASLPHDRVRSESNFMIMCGNSNTPRFILNTATAGASISSCRFESRGTSSCSNTRHVARAAFNKVLRMRF